MEKNKVFHLWFHPFNLSFDRKGLLSVLREVFKEAARLRDAGLLDIRTMGDLAASLSRAKLKVEA